MRIITFFVFFSDFFLIIFSKIRSKIPKSRGGCRSRRSCWSCPCFWPKMPPESYHLNNKIPYKFDQSAPLIKDEEVKIYKFLVFYLKFSPKF